MGDDKQTTQTDTRQETTVQQTEEERRLNELTLERAEATQTGQIEAQTQGLNLINQLLTGQGLPGFLGKLPGGISPEITRNIARESVEDIRPSFQTAGILDSGTALTASARVAGDVRRASEEFNIGNLLNLLNLAVGGQAQVQQPLLAQTSALGSRLAGLRTTTGTATGTSAVTSMNPFLKSFQTSLGQTFGAPKFGVGPFSFGG